jgi:hypothetical protein
MFVLFIFLTSKTSGCSVVATSQRGLVARYDIGVDITPSPAKTAPSIQVIYIQGDFASRCAGGNGRLFVMARYAFKSSRTNGV